VNGKKLGLYVTGEPGKVWKVGSWQVVFKIKIEFLQEWSSQSSHQRLKACCTTIKVKVVSLKSGTISSVWEIRGQL
jgi:hypothetical protein